MRRKAVIAIIIAVFTVAGCGSAAFAAEWNADKPTGAVNAGMSETDGVTGADGLVQDGTQPGTEPAESIEATEPTEQTQPEQRPVLKKLKKPGKPSVKCTAYKTIHVKWKVDANADGYEIYYKAPGKKKKTVKAAPTGNFDLKGLAKGKKYTVKIRSYRVQKDKTLRSKWSKTNSAKTGYTDWNGILEKYSQQEDVRQLILVKFKGGSSATLCLYDKNEPGESAEQDVWQEVLSCTAYTGSKGIDKKKEGDRKTPTGDFAITLAFGINDDPGSKMEYLKVNRNHYWCADKHYNQLVDVSVDRHSCRGEHLITYTKQYAYAMNIGYNMEGKKGKGSAIFLHCFGNYKYTLGCVAVSQNDMIKILQTCGPGTRICIYKE